MQRLLSPSKAIFKRLCTMRQTDGLCKDFQKQQIEEQGADQEVEEEEKGDFSKHRRRKSSALPITHSAKTSYMASLSTGVYGAYYYQTFRTLHEPLQEESKMDSAEKGFQDIDGGLHSVTSKFVLQYAVDNDEEIENLLSENEREKIVEFQNLLSSRYNYENIAYSELVCMVYGWHKWTLCIFIVSTMNRFDTSLVRN